MKMSKLLTVIALVMVFVLTFASCELFTPSTGNETTPPAAGQTTPPATEETTPEESTLSISVVPQALEIHAGDEIDLMFGVTVNGEATLFIEDDDGFDAEVEGTYTITYTAVTANGQTATATRTVTVLKALSALTLEVRANRLGENKWQGNLLSFKNKEFVTLNGNYTAEAAISGVFYNASNAAITVSIPGGYGVAAVIDANGFVLEGRDGANTKLVNQANPDRAASSATSIEIDGETVTVASAFAKNLTVPAGGYAIVVQNGYCGTTVDSDGRGFMNYNVIYQYGNVVRLLWADNQEVLTPYVNQAPVITGHNNKVLANLTDADFDLLTAIIGGLTILDDNGTFDPSDDTAVEVTVANNGGFDINVAGSYTVTLTATDGTLTTTVTRVVEVVDNLVKVTIGDKSYDLLPDKIAVDQDLTVLGSYLFVLYTPAYEGALNWSNGWGEAFILNQYGQIVRIYDGANGKYYDADNKAGVVDAAKCTAADYLKQAFASRQEGEYLIVAPNGTAGNLTRAFFLSNRTIGAQMTIPGVTFPEAPAHTCEHVCETCGKCQDAECTEAACTDKCVCEPEHDCEHVCEYCGKCTDAACTHSACEAKCAGHENSKFISVDGKTFEAVDGKWAYNTEITATNAATKAMWIFDKNYTGSFATNGYGAAIVVDAYGKLIKIYDGANGGFWTAEGKAASAHFTTATYATVAWSELGEGELLIVLPNDGASNASRGWALSLRAVNGYEGACGKTITLTGFTFATLDKVITINGKEFTATEGKWIYNQEVTAATAAGYSMIILDKNYTGALATNGYGAAIVLDQYGKLIKIYDGANGGFYTEAGKAASAHFTTATYATVAWGELEEGQTLIIFPNDGASNAARGFALGLRTDGSIGQTATLTGIEFDVYVPDNKTITVNGKEFTANEGKWIYNQEVTAATAAGYSMIILDKNYTGALATNGYGAAIVLDQYGKLIKVYDGANLGFYQGNGKETAHFTTSNYATVAWGELQEGQTLIIFPNDGASNAARGFALGLRTDGSIGQTVTLTGFEFEALTKTLTINGKEFTAAEGKWIYNQEVTAATAAGYSMIILDKNYTGALATNGYGAAIVLDASGKLVKVYDGANLGFYQGNGKETAHFTTSNYATVAWGELQEGQTLIIFANDGASNAARGFALGLRTDGSIGKTATLTGFTFATAE